MSKTTCIINILINNRFSVTTEYNSNLVKFFKSLPKYYWDTSKKIWTFPDSEMNKVIEMMESLSIEQRFLEYMPDIKYFPNAQEDSVEIDVEWNNKLWIIFQRIVGYKWIKERQRASIPRIAFEDFALALTESFSVNLAEIHDAYDKAIDGMVQFERLAVTTPLMNKEPPAYEQKATRCWSRVRDEDIPSTQTGSKSIKCQAMRDEPLKRTRLDYDNEPAYKNKCIRWKSSFCSISYYCDAAQKYWISKRYPS